ncbi:hypothetical protein AWZ03_014776 [Drosophila navojoa]|uniref:Uncharacterized protein n=1 Tax=Drosophila navojoa TaxID=7232 RepID=A0A484ARU9_DRONA|nr:hypothetical protein AWZ03_014776 [Drosophila navojoa]
MNNQSECEPKSHSRPKTTSAKMPRINALKRKRAGKKKGKIPNYSYKLSKGFIRFMHAHCAKHKKRLTGPDMAVKAVYAWCRLPLAKRKMYKNPRMPR